MSLMRIQQTRRYRSVTPKNWKALRHFVRFGYSGSIVSSVFKLSKLFQINSSKHTLSVAMNLMGLPSSGNERTTFRPKKRKNHPSGSKLEKLITATLGSGNLREAVRLPPGEDINEWLAFNTIDFYNQVNILYATLEEFCTPTTCPIMNAGSLYEYRWADGVTIKKPITVSAPEYVEYLMNWVETQIDNETIFPQKSGAPFPPNFEDFVKVILKRLFRVYAHIYHCHFKKIVNLKEEAHLNTCFKHFVLFISEYHLIDEAELDPLKDLVEKIMKP